MSKDLWVFSMQFCDRCGNYKKAHAQWILRGPPSKVIYICEPCWQKEREEEKREGVSCKICNDSPKCNHIK